MRLASLPITGTPSGTAWSTDRELGGKWQGEPDLVPAKRYCLPGDVIECELERIGNTAQLRRMTATPSPGAKLCARSRYDAGGVRNVLGNPLLRLSPIPEVEPLGAPVRAARARDKRSARTGDANKIDGEPRRCWDERSSEGECEHAGLEKGRMLLDRRANEPSISLGFVFQLANCGVALKPKAISRRR
jgi:hypothetical protein